MKIEISQNAMAWFKEEVGLEVGDAIKFYPQIYGTSPIQEGFALGFTKDNYPIDLAVKTEVEGICFFVEDTDLWFFNGHDLHVHYNEDTDEIEYKYSKSTVL